jgi:orotidine-5'-phosphate decarboxylase
MSDRNFMSLLQDRWSEGKFVCVGLDSDVNSPKFPDGHGHFSGLSEDAAQLEFNKRIVAATHDLVVAYKPNLAFYRGDIGKQSLRRTIEYIRETAPGVPVILDAKQADIGNTNDGYVAEDFNFYAADAVTVHPYLGKEALQPFLDQGDKGIIVLCRTSNPGAGEFQDRRVEVGRDEAEQLGLDSLPPDVHTTFMPLYQLVAHRVTSTWNDNGNCAVVVGATYPEELGVVRAIVGDLPILIPGVGAQGGDLEATIRAGRNSRGQGMIVNNSRAVIFASSGEDFAEAARVAAQKMHADITATLVAA